MLPPSRWLLVTLAIILVPDLATARSFRVSQVPNGSTFGCATCHVNPVGGGSRNGFGSQVENSLIGTPASTAMVDWSAIFDLDGDSDGYSNGRELGDPDGTWTIGSGNPGGATYAPYDRTDSPCGDGVFENPPEECDSDLLPPDVTCETLGWGPGTLSCASTCRINEEQCEGYEVVIPNSTNPPANNTSPPANNANNMTTGETSGMTNEGDPEEEGGCSTTGSAPSGWLVFLATIGWARRRGSRRQSVP